MAAALGDVGVEHELVVVDGRRHSYHYAHYADTVWDDTARRR